MAAVLSARIPSMPKTGGTGTVDKGASGRRGITMVCVPLLLPFAFCALTCPKYPTATTIAATHTKMRKKARSPEDRFIVFLLNRLRDNGCAYSPAPSALQATFLYQRLRSSLAPY